MGSKKIFCELLRKKMKREDNPKKTPHTLNSDQRSSVPKWSTTLKQRIYCSLKSLPGLFILNVAFLITTGAVFQNVEGNYEESVKIPEAANLTQFRLQLISKLLRFNDAIQNCSLGGTNNMSMLFEETERDLRVYESHLTKAVQNGHRLHNGTFTYTKNWNLYGSVFYVSTLYSTIGTCCFVVR